VATDEVSFDDITRAFTEVTGKKASHTYIKPDDYFPVAEPYPNAPANWAAGPSATRDESTMTWRENFTAWWKYWGGGYGQKRDFALLDRIHPNRIKSLADWMRKVEYDGKRKDILKGAEDLRRMAASMAQQKASI